MAVFRIKCVVCGNEATKKSNKAKYCSRVCNQRAYEKRKGIKSPEWVKAKKSSPTEINKPQIAPRYLEQIEQSILPIDPRLQKLSKRKNFLLNRFARLSSNSENTEKLINILSIGTGAYLGWKKLDNDSTATDLAINLIGVPLLFRYAAKNLIQPSFNDNSLATQLDGIKTELNQISEEMNVIELEIRGREKAMQIAMASSQANIERTESYTAISANEMKKIKRNVYKLTGKWKYFLGTVEQNFKAIIHGKPKQGKSHFSIQFAQYLHETFGDVVYFAAEEGAGITMETKLTRWNANFKIVYNILGTKGIEDYIKKYKPKFVFIDSITRLSLSADNVKFFVDEYIDCAWILVCQSTKHKGHRGSQELTHLSDSNIEVKEGVAYQEGRTVNGNTELEIFAK